MINVKNYRNLKNKLKMKDSLEESEEGCKTREMCSRPSLKKNLKQRTTNKKFRNCRRKCYIKRKLLSRDNTTSYKEMRLKKKISF